MAQRGACVAPERPSRWLFGSEFGVQVWSVDGDERVRASVLIGQGGPIVLLNRQLAGTVAEHDALAWALQRIAAAEPGFYVLSAG